MSRSALDRYLYLFDKSPVLQAALQTRSPDAFADFDLDSEERQVLLEGHVARLYQWGVHPLLIRNFAATIGVKYVSEYTRHGVSF